jgi:putative ABC transport system permease protein
MGYEIKNLMVINLGSEKIKQQYKTIIGETQKIPHVLTCQPTTYFLPPSDNLLLVAFKDPKTGERKEQEAIFLAAGNVELLNIPIIEGRTFSESEAKSTDNILITEAAAKKFNVKAGEKLFHFNVIGILKNFHNKSIHEAIRPIFVIPQSSGFTNLVVKTNGENTQAANEIKRIIQKIEPGYYFEYELLSDKLIGLYHKDKQNTEIISFFSLVALSLSIMGLFGFVSLTISSKIKEIGIRKINGARSSEILVMLNVQFVLSVVIAFITASPIAYFAMTKWLENFAYKTGLSWWIFALSGLLALGIALLTVSFQSWKAASRNPVEALRYE